METLTGIMVAVLIFYSGKLMARGEVDINNFFSFLAAMMLAYQPVRSLSTLNMVINQGLSAASRIIPIIDQKNEVLAKGQYNRLLEKRIRLFQTKYDLTEDGKAGMETLLKLNAILGIAVTLDGSLAVYDKTAGQQ